MPVVDPGILNVKLLGYPEAAWESARLKLPTQKVRALLYYLAIRGRASREELAELLWDADARHRLRPELHRLRNLGGADTWLDLDDTAAVEVDTDLARFEAAVRDERYGDALEWHPERGYLLQGFAVEDAPPYTEWLEGERERVATLYRRALRGRAEELAGTDRAAEALHLVRWMLELDPLDESAYRLAMRLEYARGHIQAALGQFEACRRALAEELGIEPLEETVALLREIERGRALPAFAIAERRRLPKALLRPPSLIAREAEWTRMEAAFQQGQAIFISGPPGVGKSRLMLDFAASKGDVIMAEGRIGDENIPFSSAARLVRGYLEAYPEQPLAPWIAQELERTFTAAESWDPFALPTDEALARTDRAMLAFFLHAAEQLIVFPADDLQYFDPFSNGVIDRAATAFFRQGARRSVQRCGINTFRANEMPEEFLRSVRYFTAHDLGIHIELESLAPEAVAALLASLDLDDPALATKLHRLTGGNPQFLVETLKSLYATGQIEGVPERITPPERLVYLLGRRLDGLSTPALRIAKAIATLERELGTEELADLLEMNAFDVAESLGDLEEAQVVVAGQFVHDLIQEDAKRRTPATVQRHLHQRMARLLERDGGDAARIAHHYTAADERDRALPWRRRALEDAVAKGFLDEAQRLLDELLFEAPEESETYCRALVLEGRILLRRDLPRAEVRFREARESSRYLYSDAEAEALEGLAECALRRGEPHAASRLLEEALELPTEPQRAIRLRGLLDATRAAVREADRPEDDGEGRGRAEPG